MRRATRPEPVPSCLSCLLPSLAHPHCYNGDRDPEAKASFVQEMSLLKTLTHPNVLKFLGLYNKDGNVRGVAVASLWRRCGAHGAQNDTRVL